MKFLKQMLSEGGSEPSTKRVLYALSVASVLAFCAGVVVKAGELNPMVVDLLKTCVYATAGAYGVSRFAERKETPE